VSVLFWNKKAEKELQMIFGLFVLLIISLVVLSLFFKFTEKSSGKMEGASTEYFTKAELEKVRQDCQSKCDQIITDNDAIEFCKALTKVDWNGDKTIVGRATYGKWQFCEAKIPCFILVDNCKGGMYDGSKCKAILSDPANNNLEVYASITADGLEDGCALTTTGDPATSSNWKEKFQFV
jgi:hypothetical protein